MLQEVHLNALHVYCWLLFLPSSSSTFLAQQALPVRNADAAATEFKANRS